MLAAAQTPSYRQVGNPLTQPQSHTCLHQPCL